MSDKQPCPCGTGKQYSECCEPCLKGKQQAATAISLMRSRYTAYVMKNEEYLLRTWHPSTRPDQLGLERGESGHWIGLKVVTTHAGGCDDDAGMVEFVARYKINGKAHRLREKSQFVKEQGEWFYLDGEPGN